MTEAAKTSILAGIGVLTAVLAFAASREPAEPTHREDTELTRIEDASDVASLRVVRFNEASGKVDQFAVAYEDGQYVIPSHFGYPADAEEQLLNAAGSVMAVTILEPLDDDRRLHADRGMIDPLDASVGRDAEADTVGMRVTMTDSEDKELADFIIGHAVEDRQNVRYVRRAGQDRTFLVEMDTQALTTDFEKWIEKDLLRLDPLDVRGVSLWDYSVLHRSIGGVQVAAGLEQRALVQLSYDPQDLKWKLDRLLSFDQVEGQAISMELAEDQELDKAKLDGLKNALDDLKIVDVRPKPAGLAEEGALEKAGAATFADLMSRGFYFNPEERHIVSDQGEIKVDMASGVRYVLRFGRIAGSEDKAGEGEAGGAAGQEIHRYLWVSAEENLSVFPQPSLKEVPQLPAEPPAAKTDAVQKVEKAAAGDAAAEEDPRKAYERLKAQHDKIVKDNERKKSEYVAKITAAKKAVADLNRRFGAWYYVIADDTYQKIHLGRDNILKTKEPEKDAAAGAPTPGAGGSPAANLLQKGIEDARTRLEDQLPPGAKKPTDGTTPVTPAKPDPAEKPAAEKSVETTPSEQPSDSTTEQPPAEATPAGPGDEKADADTSDESQSTQEPSTGDSAPAKETAPAEEEKNDATS